jgi:hypothetical protein
MDMDHHHDTVSTPWNPNLSYAIYWSIALGVPIVWLSGRNAASFVNKAIEHWRQKNHAHTRLASEEPKEDEDHHQRRYPQQISGVAVKQGTTAM